MPFIGKQSTSNSQITNYTTTVGSGGQTNFTVVIEGGDETHVYLNGVLLKETTDYTVSSTQVSLVSAAVENDIVEIKVFRSFALVDAVKATGGTFSGDVTLPNLTLSSNVIKASDGGSTITLDTSDNVTLAGNLVIPDGGNIGSTSDTDAISIASNGKPTFSAGIANTGTIDAGTIGSAVSLANATFPAGHVIQTVQNTYNSNNSQAITGSTFTRFTISDASMPFTAQITNVESDSHVYIQISCTIESTNSADRVDMGTGIGIFRESTGIFEPAYTQNYFYGESGSSGISETKTFYHHMNIVFVDTSPGTGTNNYYAGGKAYTSSSVKIRPTTNFPFVCILQEIAQ